MKTFFNLKVIIPTLILFIGVKTVNAQCQASYTYTNNGNGEIIFTNTSSGGVDFYWEFDDGSDTLDMNPVHTFSVGTYLVCLTIEDSSIACTSTFCDSIVVSDPEPDTCTLSASYTYVDDSAGVYTFTSNVTGGTPPYSYSWSFGDITPDDYNQDPTHTFYYDATYDICLIVTDSLGCNYVLCDSLVINGLNTCNVFSGFTYTDNGGGNYSFSSTSTGNIVIRYWRFGSAFSNLLTPSYSFPMDGTYLVSLYVADSNNFCNDYATEYITVSGVSNPVACNASFTIYTDSVFNGVSVMNTSGGNNLSYFWDFGDGNTSNLAYPNYTYGSGGPYELCLTVTSDSSCTSTYCDTIASGGVVNKGGFSMNILAPTITSVNQPINQKLDVLSVYPNPIKDNLTIKLQLVEQSHVEIVIFDLLGNTIETVVNRELNTGNNVMQWKTGNTPNGVYLLHVITDGKLQVAKLILNK